MEKSILEGDIFQELESIPTIDAHEHLPTEESRIDKQVDCFNLFNHYCIGDLISAGAKEEDLAFWSDKTMSLEERWQRFKPFFLDIKTGAYARSALIYIKEVLGFDDINDETYIYISHKLQESNKPGLYNKILREKCNIKACIQCWQYGEKFPDYFFHLAPSPQVVDVFSLSEINSLSNDNDIGIHTIDDLLECMTLKVHNWKEDSNVVGIKSAHAYSRSIEFKKTSKSDAEKIFSKIFTNEEHKISLHEAIPLQNFLMYELLARAEAYKIPMVFHTGLQAGNFNRISNTNPLLLQNLFEEFPKARFDLFHAGLPWYREIGVLAKYFPNVYLNMAWTHIINPAQARMALSEWLDMIPNSKIFGFGGDYSIVEKVYGHIKLARKNIASVLAEKITEGSYSRKEVSMLAQKLMYDNPKKFYNLPL